MTTTSISQLKINPSSIIAQASEYPIAVENRNTIQGYIMGKALYEKMVELLEDQVDTNLVYERPPIKSSREAIANSSKN